MKIALVHDYLKEYGGAERVLESLHDIWPEAPVFTSFVDWESLGPHRERLKKWDIHTTWADNWFMRKFHSPLRFMAPWIWESLDFRGFDVVISSSGWYMSKGIITQPETMHLGYLHHPPRHLYGYATAVEWQKHLVVRVYAAVVNCYLRIYDYLSAQRVDYFIANSQETQKRIAKFYRRESTVIYPPVKTSPYSPPSQGGDRSGQKLPRETYFLCVSRLARAKHIDLAIDACQELGVTLKIVGKGRDEQNLKLKVKSPHFAKASGSTGWYLPSRGRQKSKVEFLGEVKDEELGEIYHGARALICPFEDEEFGIVAAEAMGHGVPVIAFNSGGLPEVIVNGKTGILFDELTVNSLLDALKKFDGLRDRTITAAACRQQAEKFSEEVFRKTMQEYVGEKWREYTKT